MVEVSELCSLLGDFLNMNCEVVRVGYDLAVCLIMQLIVFAGKFLIASIDLMNRLLDQIILAQVIFLNMLGDYYKQMSRLAVIHWWTCFKVIYQAAVTFVHYCKKEFQRLAVTLVIVGAVILIRFLELLLWIVKKIHHLLERFINRYPGRKNQIDEKTDDQIGEESGNQIQETGDAPFISSNGNVVASKTNVAPLVGGVS